MKKGDIKTIKIPSKWAEEIEEIQAEFLGAGEFARCYRKDNTVYSFVSSHKKEVDYSKQAIAGINTKNIFIPDIENLGILGNIGIMVYKMAFYQDLKPENKTAWSQFKTLQKACENINVNDYKFGYDRNNLIIDSVREVLPVELIEALENINSACSNYSQNYYFEFQQRNLKVDEQGNLILLDVIFNAHATKAFLQYS